MKQRDEIYPGVPNFIKSDSKLEKPKFGWKIIVGGLLIALAAFIVLIMK